MCVCVCRSKSCCSFSFNIQCLEVDNKNDETARALCGRVDMLTRSL